MIDFLLNGFRANANQEAIVSCGQRASYGGLLDTFDRAMAALAHDGISAGDVIALSADFSLEAVAMLLALVETGCIVVPMSASSGPMCDKYLEISGADATIVVDSRYNLKRTGRRSEHALYGQLRGLSHPGLVLFSSGSTGEIKAAVHDFVPLLEKFQHPRRRLRTIAFLLFDHIGGVNTLLYTLSNCGCVISLSDRNPESVCDAIEKYGAELLPTSPTFLNLLLASESYMNHDLGTLETITYGTEPMPESTLQRLAGVFPGVRLQQTYGLSEVGILRSKSRSSDSLWVKVGGEGFETRIVDGILHIRARSAMLGYLNAPSPFDANGWLNTGDAVEVDGDYVRFLGRRSDVINVGGEKVYPAEVEGVIEAMPGVEECVVYGTPNPIVGQTVSASVVLSSGETVDAFTTRMWEYCRNVMQRYKVPQEVNVHAQPMHSPRFKKRRTKYA